MTTVGIFDSGVGGFSVVRPLLARFPNLSMIYVADTAHVPYSGKTKEELEEIVGRILQFLLESKVNSVIFACNTSSALILPDARAHFPIPAYGVVDAGVAAAIETTQGKGIGVVANEVTARSGVFSRRIKEKNAAVPVYEVACPLLVPLVESGDLPSPRAQELVSQYCEGLREKIDTLLLACTHFPFLEDYFKRALPGVAIIDPADRVVDEVSQFLKALDHKSHPNQKMFATKNPDAVASWLKKVLHWDMRVEALDLEALRPWKGKIQA